MAYFKYTAKLLRGEGIQIFNYGNCERDFTYVDDIVERVVRVIDKPPSSNDAPHKVYNIGNSQPVKHLEYVDILQQELIRAEVLPADYDFDNHKKLVPMQPGDVPITYADTSDLERDFAFRPNTSLRDGLRSLPNGTKNFIAFDFLSFFVSLSMEYSFFYLTRTKLQHYNKNWRR